MGFLDTDLNEQDTQEFTKILENWQASEFKKMKKAYSDAKEKAISKIEESLVAYKKDLKSEYVDKTNQIIESLKPQIRKQILEEMSDSDPKFLVMDKIIEMVLPLVNEESGKTYVNEISLLKREKEEIQNKLNLKEGYEKKQELLANYTGKTRKILDKLLGEGTKEQIIERFYDLNESFEDLNEKKDEDEDFDFSEDEDEEKDEKSKKKTKKSDEDFDFSEDDEEDDENDEEDKEEDEKTKKVTKKKKDEEEIPESFQPTVKSKTVINEEKQQQSFKDKIKMLI